MNKLIRYTLNRIGQKLCSSEDLDNRAAYLPREESEEEMPLNTSKIRRQVTVNGTKVWLTANSEQEYANKLLRLAMGPQGDTRPQEKHPFKAYADNWFEVFSKPNIDRVTAVTYERQLRNYIYPILNGLNVEDITAEDVQRVFNAMGDDMKQGSKDKVKNVLNQIFNKAIDDGFIMKNPLKASSIRIKGLAAEETEPYTIEQMRYLASHLNDVVKPADRAWLALSLSLPLRPEEVLGLKWEDVDEKACMIHVRNTVTHPTRNEPHFKSYTKTASSVRHLVFPQEILAYLPERGQPDEFVIGGEKPLSYMQLRGLRKRINYQTKFGETITPRRFRTTVATDISAMTHDLKLVQKSLGHSTPQITLKHYDKGRSRAADASQAIASCYGLTAN